MPPLNPVLAAAAAAAVVNQQHIISVMIATIIADDALLDEEDEQDMLDEEEELAIAIASLRVRQPHRMRQDKWAEFMEYDPYKWKQQFRVKREVFNLIGNRLAALPEFQMKDNISVTRFLALEEKLALFLYRMGSRKVADCADKFGVSQWTVSNVTKLISRAIVRVFPEAVMMLRRGSPDWVHMKQQFRDKNFEGCVGVVDCTHFRIVVDTITRRSGAIEAFNNHKKYTSLSYQVITDLSLKFRSLFGGCSGSVSDKTLWRRSPTFKRR